MRSSSVILAGIASGGIKKLNAVEPSGRNLNAKKGERMMKRLLFLILSATIVVGSVFVGWAQEKKEPYKIGVVNNSTGATGTFGIMQNNGVELAAEVINKAGGVNGHPIVPIIYDGETKPDVNLRMARKLIQQDKVKVLIGPNFTPGIGSIAPLVNEVKIPMIKFGGYIVNPIKDPYVFSVTVDNEVMAQGIVEYYRGKGIKKIAIAAVKTSYGEEYLASYKKYLAKYPDMMIVATEWFMPEDTDITPQISKLIAIKPDVIGACSFGANSIQVVRTAYKLGFKGPVGVTHSEANEAYAESIKDIPAGYSLIPARNACIKALVDAMPAGPRKAWSLKIMGDWEKKFGSLRHIEIGSVGYEALDIYAKALKAVGYDSEKVKQWLESTEIMTSVGPIRMTPTDHVGSNPKDAVVALTTENGRFLPAK